MLTGVGPGLSWGSSDVPGESATSPCSACGIIIMGTGAHLPCRRIHAICKPPTMDFSVYDGVRVNTLASMFYEYISAEPQAEK